jgi:AraC-like DNA-binding protein
MQWIRQQRMQVALQRLQNPHPRDSVAAVALSCGYRSQSRFRIDFERTFGCKPSAVLRGEQVPPVNRPAEDAAD